MTNRWPLSVSRGANERNIGSVQAPPSRKSLVWGTLFVGFHKNSNHTLEAGALVYSAPGFVKVVRGETKRKADQKSSYDIHTLEVLFLYSSRKKQQRVNAHTEIIVTYCTRLRQLTVVQESTTKRPFARKSHVLFVYGIVPKPLKFAPKLFEINEPPFMQAGPAHLSFLVVS